MQGGAGGDASGFGAAIYRKPEVLTEPGSQLEVFGSCHDNPILLLMADVGTGYEEVCWGLPGNDSSRLRQNHRKTSPLPSSGHIHT